MMLECVREEEVLDALASNRWPSRCGEELRTHVQHCRVCADLAEVAESLSDDGDVAWREARVPPPGVVWWRAQLRAREDAARAAGRPVAFIQGVAASVAVWLAVSLYRTLPPDYTGGWRTWAAGVLPSVKIALADVTRVASTVPVAIVIVIGASLLLAPLAIYFALADE
jgi:hypothetical protein